MLRFSERHQGVIPSSFFRTADGCLLVYDVTAKEVRFCTTVSDVALSERATQWVWTLPQSWTQLLKWRDELLNKLPVAVKEEFPITVIGNKIDEQPEGGSGVDFDEVGEPGLCTTLNQVSVHMIWRSLM
jgi:GTPase SAR1 family protein